MTTGTSLTRRLKRHVIARSHRFYAVAAPGLETLCARELETLPAEVEGIAPDHGGVHFAGRLTAAYAANLHLRTASRVLMRVAAFEAQRFDQLERQAAAIPWELYLPAAPVRVRAALHHSRIYHSGAAAQRIREAVATRLAAAGAAPVEALAGDAGGVVYLRAAHNRFTLSVDSSGSHLHRRGLKTWPGRAPLRETLAAAALLLAGYDGRRPLLDPMCGSGTFALEAAAMAKGIPAGWHREFAFRHWPAFRPGAWAHLRRQAAQGLRLPASPLVLASDHDPGACALLAQGIAAAGLEDTVRVQCQNFLDTPARDLPPARGLVALNPPYGRRLGSASQGRDLFREVAGKLRADFHGWRAVLVVPERALIPLLPNPRRVLAVTHGGLEVHLTVVDIP
jgi:putative N6-adenine-specific DNA methylase